MEKALSSSLLNSATNYKARRLKILQELEDRKLQINNEKLTKAQNKFCRQLDIQRLQLTRRFSESNFSSALLEDLREPSKTDIRRKYSVHSCHSNLAPLDHFSSLEHKFVPTDPEQPFWLRIPSLGILPDEDQRTYTINNKLGIQGDDILNSDSMISANNAARRSASVSENRNTDGSEVTQYKRRSKRSSSTEERTPTWLLSLYQLRREKILNLKSEKREELAALVSGNKGCDAKNCLIPHICAHKR